MEGEAVKEVPLLGKEETVTLLKSTSPQPSQMPVRGVSSPDISKETRSRPRVARKKKTSDRKSSGNWREAVSCTASVMSLPPVQGNPKLTPHPSEEPCNIYSEVLKKRVQGHPERKTRMADDQKHLEERLQRLELEISHSKSFSESTAGSQAELQSLRKQAQELVDENDALKLTVHRINVELSDYQARFRPRTQQESSKPSGLTKAGSPPPSLFDMKYLSPLFLAYDDKINEKDKLLLTAEEEGKKLRVHAEDVIKENEKLHEKISKMEGAVSQNDCQQLQQQALRVLEENQVLVDQLEAQHVKAKASHSRHQSEVTKVSKQLMLLEAEKQQIQEELEESRREVQRYVKENKVLQTRLKDTISWEEHCSTTDKLRRQLEQQQSSSQMEKDELFGRVSRLQEENKRLAQDKANLTAILITSQAELELSKQGNRKAERRLSALKRQKEEFVLEEERTRHHLGAVVSVAENISLERDYLLHMASVLQKEKQKFMGKILKGTVRYGKLEEEVKVYRRQASKRLTALEEAAEGRTASHQREILHLQRLLRERREAEEKLLQSKREVQEELEVVWQAAIRENQRMKGDLLDIKPGLELQGWTLCGSSSSDCMAQPADTITSPEHQQKHGLDFYC
ncbi:centrosomal protein of 89 kDa isoform X2 [Gouania willdenowi]|uniref:centrosomal protein of 89 kDa isoform X2 n=1 Tax=Gouania willdenowi TaxID=441366 RepID=UPI001055800A|nr:centrosomal protein of 89 kDa isoform X2 [Gouania willdenowi]